MQTRDPAVLKSHSTRSPETLYTIQLLRSHLFRITWASSTLLSVMFVGLQTTTTDQH